MIRLLSKFSLLVLITFTLLAGCKPPDVEIIISPDYQSATIQIDFVRVKRSEVPMWMGLSIDDYFTPGNQFREFAKQRGDIYTVFYNVPQKPFQGVIESDDPVWETIEFERGTSEQEFDVIILADIPGVPSGAPSDIRRQVIPMQKKLWSVSLVNKLLGKTLDKLTISITSRGILLNPEPDEGK